jgi:hypothetical protein
VRQRVSLLQVLLKLLLIQAKEEPGDSYPVISEWGGAWAVPRQVRAALGQSVVNLKCSIFCESQTFPNFNLPQEDTVAGEYLYFQIAWNTQT